MTQIIHSPLKIPLKFPMENQWILMQIQDFWWKSMVLGQFWGHFWAKVHKIINHWNERCTVVVWVLYATWIISECSGPSNMVILSSWHLISCRTAQIPLGARHPISWTIVLPRWHKSGVINLNIIPKLEQTSIVNAALQAGDQSSSGGLQTCPPWHHFPGFKERGHLAPHEDAFLDFRGL